MEILELEKTDLKRLAAEVKTAEDALPANLSDEWLSSLSRDLEVVLEEEYGDEDRSNCLSAPMYFVGLISDYKEQKAGNLTGEFELSMEEMLDYFTQYRIELSLESLNRAEDDVRSGLFPDVDTKPTSSKLGN